VGVKQKRGIGMGGFFDGLDDFFQMAHLPARELKRPRLDLPHVRGRAWGPGSARKASSLPAAGIPRNESDQSSGLYMEEISISGSGPGKRVEYNLLLLKKERQPKQTFFSNKLTRKAHRSGYLTRSEKKKKRRPPWWRPL